MFDNRSAGTDVENEGVELVKWEGGFGGGGQGVVLVQRQGECRVVVWKVRRRVFKTPTHL